MGEPVGASTVATLGVEGGDIVLVGTSHTYTLHVPPTALIEDTAFQLSEATLAGAPDVAVVRFEPAGLVFEVAAVLDVDRAPAGALLLGLAFYAGSPGAALSFPVVEDGVASMTIEHFSEAAVGDAATLTNVLDEPDRALVADVEDATETAAQALGDRYRGVVDPALRQAHRSLAKWRLAKERYDAWKIQVQQAAAEGESATVRGQQTLGDLFDVGLDTLHAQGRALLADRTSPDCIPGTEVKALLDWARVPAAILAELQLASVVVDAPELCVTRRVTGTLDPAAMTSSTDELTLELNHEIVGPDGEVELIEGSEFSIDATGATGPTSVAALSGFADGLVFTRPEGASRRRGITLTVTASTVTPVQGLPAAAPLTLTLSEPMTLALTSTPSTLSSEGTTEVCATATSAGVSVPSFSVRFAVLSGGGSVSAGEIVTTTGSACATYTTPSPYPAETTPVVIEGTLQLDGGGVRSQTTLELRGAVTFEVTVDDSTPSEQDVLTPCVFVTGPAGQAAADLDVVFSARGFGGDFSPAAVTTDGSGFACASLFITNAGSGAVPAQVVASATVDGRPVEGRSPPMRIEPSLAGTWTGACNLQVTQTVRGEPGTYLTTSHTPISFAIGDDITVLGFAGRIEERMGAPGCAGTSTVPLIGVVVEPAAGGTFDLTFQWGERTGSALECNGLPAVDAEETVRLRRLGGRLPRLGMDRVYNETGGRTRLGSDTCRFSRAP